MFTRNKKQSGFTLIELLVVVIIVAVLAAVGIPLLSGNIERARLSEAEAGLGTIRTSMRAEFAEQGAAVGWSTLGAPVAPVAANIGLNAGDLTGRFFADADYVITAAEVATFCAGVTGSAASAAPRGDQVAGLTRSMNQDGTLFDDAVCGGTVLN